MRSLFGGDGALVEIEEMFLRCASRRKGIGSLRSERQVGGCDGKNAGRDAGATKSTLVAICDRREDLSWGESKPAPSKN
jgi:hypothetical protein